MTGLDFVRAMGGLLLMVAGFMLFAAGCGGPPAAAQQTLTVTARGLVELDQELAPRYAVAADSCRAASASWDEYDDCLDAWNVAEAALRTSRSALLAAQAGHDVWDDGTDEGATWTATLPCLVLAIAHVIRTVEAVGIEVPEVLNTALDLAQGFGGSCHE